MAKKEFYKYKTLIKPATIIFNLFPKRINILLWDIASLFSGKIAIGIRYCVAKALMKSLGNNVYFGKFVKITYWPKLVIGNNVSIHDFCYLGSAGGIEIGNDVSIAHNCSILTATHNYDNELIPIRDQGLSISSVKIGSNVWLGCGVRVLYKVEIKDSVIIGANSVVNKVCESGYIYAGTPVRKIKSIYE